MRVTHWASAALILAAFASTACEGDKPTSTAPSATTLKDTKPKAAGAMDFSIETTGAKVDFMMEAPNEKIRGHVADATKGEVQIDLADVTKTTGHLYVDLQNLTLYQQIKGADGEFGEEKKSDLQNEHAQNWLEIAPCADGDDKSACETAKKKNENVEFVITKVETDKKDVTKLTGAERKINATVTGDFLLHQKKTTKTAKVEITFMMKGDKPESVKIKTIEGFAIGLAEHDVRPRTAFGKLAAKTLDALVSEDKKVAKEAAVSFELAAKFKGMAKAGGTATKPAGAK
jgi:hypothetical protein